MVTNKETAANPVPLKDRRRGIPLRTNVAIAPNPIISLPVRANQTDSMIGGLQGIVVGNGLRLPGAGLSKHRQRQIYPNITRHHFFFSKEMVSDDNKPTCIFPQSLILSGDNEQKIYAQVLRMIIFNRAKRLFRRLAYDNVIRFN